MSQTTTGRLPEEEMPLSFNMDFIQSVMLHLDKKKAFSFQAVSKLWKCASESLHSLLYKNNLLLLNLQLEIQGCEYARDYYPHTTEYKVISRNIGRADNGCFLAFGGDIICYEDSGGFYRLCNSKTKECFHLPYPDGTAQDMFAFGCIEEEGGRSYVLVAGRLGADDAIRCSILHMFTYGHRGDLLQVMFWKEIAEVCPAVLKGAGLVLDDGIFWMCDLDLKPRNPVVFLRHKDGTFHTREGPTGWKDEDYCSLAGRRGKVVFTTCTKEAINIWEWDGLAWLKMLVVNIKDHLKVDIEDHFKDHFQVLPRHSADGFLLVERHHRKNFKLFYILDLGKGRISLILEKEFPLHFEIGFCRESLSEFVAWDRL